MTLLVDTEGDGIVNPRQYPFALAPNTSTTVFLSSISRFRENVAGILAGARFGPRLAARLVRAYVYTNDGSLFRATISGNVRKELKLVAGKTPPKHVAG